MIVFCQQVQRKFSAKTQFRVGIVMCGVAVCGSSQEHMMLSRSMQIVAVCKICWCYRFNTNSFIETLSMFLLYPLALDTCSVSHPRCKARAPAFCWFCQGSRLNKRVAIADILPGTVWPSANATLLLLPYWIFYTGAKRRDSAYRADCNESSV